MDMIGYELRTKIEEVKKKFEDAKKVFEPDLKRKELEEYEKIMSQPSFWDDSKKAQDIIKKSQRLSLIHI